MYGVARLNPEANFSKVPEVGKRPGTAVEFSDSSFRTQGQPEMERRQALHEKKVGLASNVDTKRCLLFNVSSCLRTRLRCVDRLDECRALPHCPMLMNSSSSSITPFMQHVGDFRRVDPPNICAVVDHHVMLLPSLRIRFVSLHHVSLFLTSLLSLSSVCSSLRKSFISSSHFLVFLRLCRFCFFVLM